MIVILTIMIVVLALAVSTKAGESTASDIVQAATGFLGGTLNASQIKQLAANAGFFGDDLNIAVAVALAESGGDVSAYNPEIQAGTPLNVGSVGLWQIYQYKHPEFAAWDLQDPQQNANAAYSVYNAAGASFRPWSTFKSGAYLQYYSEAVNA